MDKELREREEKRKKNNNFFQRAKGFERDADDLLEFPEVNFKMTEFESKIALDAYLEDPEHGKTPEKPGVCFGFTVHEKKRNNFELELFFNDLFVKEYQSIP